MPVSLTPIGQNPYRNTVDEILRFVGLDLSVIQTTSVEEAIYFAADTVAFIAPEAETGSEDEARSLRTEPLRKRAEAYLAAAELYVRLSTDLGISTPPKQILSTLNIQIGTDFPTQVDLLNAFSRVAERYRSEGMRILRMIRPNVDGLEAGLSIDDD